MKCLRVSFLSLAAQLHKECSNFESIFHSFCDSLLHTILCKQDFVALNNEIFIRIITIKRVVIVFEEFKFVLKHKVC